MINYSLSQVNNAAITLCYPIKYLYRIANSIVGRKIIGAINENIAEFLGAYAGADLGSRALKVVVASSLGLTGKITGIALVIYGCKTTGNRLLESHHLADRRRKICAAVIYCIVSAGAFILLPEYLSSKGEAIGSAIGAFLGYHSGEIVGAWLAIKLYGSEEKLWIPDSPARSYTIKAFQNIAASQLAEPYTPQIPVIAPILALLFGSLTFNLLDLCDGAQVLRDGKLFKGIMPRESELITELTSSLIDISALSPNTFSLQCIAVQSSIEQIPFTRENRWMKYWIQRLVSEQTIVSDMEESIQRNILVKIVQLNTNQTEIAIAQTINPYFSLINNDSEIQRKLTTFDFAVTRTVKNPTLAARVRLAIAKRALVLTIQSKLLIYLLSQISPMNAQAASKINSILNLERASLSTLFRNEALDIGRIIERAQKILYDAERQVVGFSPSSYPPVARTMQEFLDVHIALIIKCAILQILCAPFPLSDHETKAFYQNLTQMVCRIYQPLLGSFIAKKIEGFLKYQIEHSTSA